LDLDNKVNEANDIREDEIPPIDEEIFLDGITCDEQAKIWNQVAQKAREGKHILVTMKQDWIAPNSGNHNFGEGLGFSNGEIRIPANTTITLDLNGCTIDRRLSQTISEGRVFIVYGTLILKDSKYNSVAVQNAYNANPASSSIVEVAKSNGSGSITGGNLSQSGGGIALLDNAKFYMYSGLICDNKADANAGGIYGGPQTSMKIYDGIIANNSATAGGGIMVGDGAQFSFYNGFIFNNKAIGGSGGGIHMLRLTEPANIYGGVIAKNTALDDGGGILVGYCTLNMHGGILDRNIASGVPSSCGGGICGLTGVMNISGVKITNNECGYLGGGLYNQDTEGVMTIKDTLITGNNARIHEGVTTSPRNGGAIIYGQSKLRLGAGCIIYTNYAEGVLNNLPVSSSNKIEIYENLLTGGKAFRVAVAASSSTGVFTSGLRAHSSSLTPNQLFLADNGMTVNADSNGEAVVGTTNNTAKTITWKWGTGQSTNNYAEVPYTGQTYTISAVVAGTNTAVSIQPVSGTGTTSLSIREPGSYSFYTTGNYRAATFQIKVLEPKQKITKPVQTETAFLLNGKQQAYVPQGFDSSKMEIAYNRATEPGQYTATVRLKDAWNTTWADGSTGNLTFTYKIIRDSVIGANSEYDYVYKDDENKRQNYTDNKVYHKYNDNSLNVVNGTPRYVIGNINANTSVRDFITKLQSEDITKVKLFDSNGTLIYNGTTQSSSYDTSKTV
ncbi:MAG TPA: hypothetical protein PLZ09_04885, partial [Clostridia bacterium]|nr:hypothetical protein [Clostridia bacterium]